MAVIAPPVVIVGIGELGGVFARGLLRLGQPIVPVTRKQRTAERLAASLETDLVLVTVGDKELDDVLAEVPAAFRDRVGLVQNELLPHTWQEHDVRDPTVCVVWFEKKPGRDVHVVQPSVAFGPSAELLVRALAELRIPARAASAAHDELLFELVSKNLYILTTNLAGLMTGGTVSDLWRKHQPLAHEVASEVLDLQERLAGATLERQLLLARLEQAFAADPEHQCTGRSADERLTRALRHADREGLAVPRLRAIAASRNS
jgi:ketopantoate reductase